MAPSNLRDLLKAQPFRPFRIHMSDGSSYEVSDPTFAHVSKFAFYVATDPDETDLPTRNHVLNTLQITSVEELPNESAA